MAEVAASRRRRANALKKCGPLRREKKQGRKTLECNDCLASWDPNFCVESWQFFRISFDKNRGLE